MGCTEVWRWLRRVILTTPSRWAARIPICLPRRFLTSHRSRTAEKVYRARPGGSGFSHLVEDQHSLVETSCRRPSCLVQGNRTLSPTQIPAIVGTDLETRLNTWVPLPCVPKFCRSDDST